MIFFADCLQYSWTTCLNKHYFSTTTPIQLCFLFEISIVYKFFVALLFFGIIRFWWTLLDAQIWFPCRVNSFWDHPTRNRCQLSLCRAPRLSIQFHPLAADFRQGCRSLLPIARLAASDNIFPRQRTALRSRNHVIEG